MRLLRSLRKRVLSLTSSAHREQFAAFRKWRRDSGESLRLEHPFLTPNSTVLDLGGYRGEWSDGIFARYQPQIHVFEPHPHFARDLTEKYGRNNRIRVHDCALASQDGEFHLTDSADASSAVRGHEQTLACRAVQADAYLRGLGLATIELVKINIEGGEYDILPHLVQTGWITRIGRLQIQFHLFERKHATWRDAIRQRLALTHRESWCYPFVWEQWDRIEPLAAAG